MINEILTLVAGAVVAYLLGSVSTSVWLGKIFYGKDVRKEGSGNAGATNSIRVLGLKAGIIVLLIDAFKAWLAVSLAPFFHAADSTLIALVDYSLILGILAVIGHVFPVYTGFKGGKGVASLVGMIIALYPYAFLLIFAWFVIIFILSRYVSLASITSAILFPILVILVFKESTPSLIVMSILVAVFVPLTHHKNIRRLLRGEELKMSFKNKNAQKNS